MLTAKLQAIESAMSAARARGLAIPVENALLFRTLLLVGRAPPVCR